VSDGAFDGQAYRREVLVALRERSPAEVDDLFWLAGVPREADDGTVAARLTETRGFLFKERSRPRQAAVAAAVLKEWERVEATLLDPAARSALLRRLEAERPVGTEDAPPVPAAPARPRPAAEDRASRRRRQVAAGLDELARLREEPELGTDLYAFLGLPLSAPPELLAARIAHVAEVNRRRRPDRERTLVDDLLAHARHLLLEGDPADYLAGLGGAARDRAVQALLGGGVEAARAALAEARREGVGEAAVLAALAPLARDAAGLVALSPHGLGVWCPSCGSVATQADTTCPACRAGLRLRCPSCGALAPADAPACPACATSLDAPRAPLLARRAGVDAERAALAEVDAAPEAEREARLRALAVEHPEWAEAARRLAAAPPPPPSGLAVSFADGEARLRWEAPAASGVEAYLVERHEGGQTRVLGRTALLEWVEAQPAPGGEVRWTVRALRGTGASAPAEVAAPVAAPDPASADPDPSPEPAPAAQLAPSAVSTRREPGGDLLVTWEWEPGVTECFVAWGPAPPAAPEAATGGRKVTNMRYELDGGARLEGVPAGAHLAVFTGSRVRTGTLQWMTDVPDAARAVAP